MGPRPNASLQGGVVIVAATSQPPFEVGGQPAHCVVSEGCLCNGCDEFCVVDRAKSLGQIICHGGVEWLKPWITLCVRGGRVVEWSLY